MRCRHFRFDTKTMMIFNKRVLLAMKEGSVGYFRTCVDYRFQFLKGAQCTRSIIALDILRVSFPFFVIIINMFRAGLCTTYLTIGRQLWKRKKTTLE